MQADAHSLAPRPSPSQNQSRIVLLAALALLVTALAFARGLSGELVYDDQFTVARNPLITSLVNVPRMFAQPMWEFTGSEDIGAVGYWRPLASVILALGWAVGGLDPFAYHLISLALHVFATAVAFRLALRLTRAPDVAFFAAILFGVHPLHVESVSWISAVNDPLFGAFTLLSVDAWVRWRDGGSRGVPRAAAAWFLCGMLSKELAAAVVPIVLAYDALTGQGAGTRGRARAAFRDYAPLAAVLALVYVARVFVFGGASAGFDRVTTDFGVGFGRLRLLHVEIVGGLLALSAWPHPLQVFPPFVPGASFEILWRPLAAILGAFAAWACATLAESRVARFAVLFALAALLPLIVSVESLGIFPVSGRYAYVAVFGVTLLASVAVCGIRPRVVGHVCLGAAAIALALQTHARTAVWKDDVTLLTQAAAESARSPYVHGVLGNALLLRYQRGRDVADLSAAHAAFQTALDLASAGQHGDQTIFATSEDFVRANVGLGWSLVCEAEIDEYHDFETALTVFKMVTTRYPRSVEGWNGRGVCEFKLGRLDEAESALRHAIELEPRHAEARVNLGRVRAKRLDWRGAEALYREALDSRPDHLETLLLLAGSVERGGDDARAADLFARAAEIAPLDPRPRVELGVLRAKAGDMTGAIGLFDAALELRPEDGRAWLEKGRALAARGERVTALDAFQRACNVLTDDFEAHYNAGALLLAQQEISAAIPYLARAYESRPENATGKALRDILLQLPIHSADVYVALATTDGERNDPDGALAWIAKALALAPDDGRAHFLKGGMLRMKGRTTEALAEMKLALAATPNSLMALQASGALSFELGDKAAALDYFERALAVARSTQGKSKDAAASIEALTARIEELKRAPK